MHFMVDILSQCWLIQIFITLWHCFTTKSYKAITHDLKGAVIYGMQHVDLHIDGKEKLSYNICKCIFVNENCSILIQISLMSFLKSPVENKPALMQIMAWHQTGDMS